MTETVPEGKAIPIARTTPFDPPPELAKLCADEPLSRMRFPDGHVGWLVTNYELARSVLSDRRFSSRNEWRRPVIPLPVVDDSGRRPMLPGAFVAMDPPDHTRIRRLLTGQFTVRAMARLKPHVAAIVDEHIDEMLRVGPPLDLVHSFALPIPALVISQLLGVPYEHRERFQHDSAMLVRLDVSRAEAEASRVSMLDFLLDLVRLKRAAASEDEDIISGLLRTGAVSDEEIAGIAFLLLFAGYETTASMIGVGMFALLSHPAQLAALRADPALVDGAVEELLRYLSVVQLGTVRGALEDIELGGSVIPAGDSVCVSLPAANRDPAKFAGPDDLDVTRRTKGQLAFGHGIHQCLGQELARIELRACYTALLRRLPEVRLAVAPEDVRMRSDMIIYGVHNLPITWDVA